MLIIKKKYNYKKILILLLIFILLCIFINNFNLFTENLEFFNSEFSKNKIQKKHFITYGDNNVNCKNRIKSEAENFECFDTITIYSREDITPDFNNKFKDILNYTRGGGYWVWKFDIILSKLNEIDYNDILVYTDCGTTININGKNRFYEYIDLLNKSNYGIISLEMNYIEKEWTTKQLFNNLDIDMETDIANSGQYTGAILIMKKNEHTLMIFNKCIELLNKDHNLITDTYNIGQNAYFKDNRHDQSILSLVRKKYNSIVLKNDYNDLWRDINEENNHIPFIASRKQ